MLFMVSFPPHSGFHGALPSLEPRLTQVQMPALLLGLARGVSALTSPNLTWGWRGLPAHGTGPSEEQKQDTQDV